MALAGRFARSGIEVGIANSRGPGSIDRNADGFDGKVVPLTLGEALEADVIVLAVPFPSHAQVAGERTDWTGKVVVDAMNTYGIPPAELAGRASTGVVSTLFPSARVVKAFNQLPAKLLARDPGESGDRRVMFVSSDDEGAEDIVAKLVADLGFAPIKLGRVDEGGRLIGLGGPLILQNLVRL